ncbi:MAG: cation transporter [Gammaproteobacteria bacterium]|nr:MAG: cation transporter [Gammaproteobacteria bacterium]
MNDCCNDKSCAVELLRERQIGTLRIVLLINAAMFVVELSAGLLADSIALLADSLDMLGDALVYGFSLYVVALGPVWKARAALMKAVVMAAFGLSVLAQAVYKMIFPELPGYFTMGGIGVLALAANTYCFLLLWRHRGEDINMDSVWLCSRNDLFANTGVLFAAWAVWYAATPWPDILVGLLICGLFLHSAWQVIRQVYAARLEIVQHGSE